MLTNIRNEGARLAVTNRSVETSFGGMFARIAGGVSVVQLLKNTLKEAANLQQIKLSFETLLQSQERALNMIKELRTISSQTGFDFDQVADAARLYLSLGGNAQEATRDLKAVAAQAAAMGKGADQIDRVVLALGQIKAKGFLSGEEVRQLANNNVKVWQYLTKVLNVDVGTAMDMARRKMIDAGAAVQVILKGLMDEFGPSLEKRLRTVPGAFDRLVNNIKVSMAGVGEAFFESINSVNVLLSASESVEDIGKVVADTIRLLGGLNTRFVGTSETARALATVIRLLTYYFSILVAIKALDWLLNVAEGAASATSVLGKLAQTLKMVLVMFAGVEIGRFLGQMESVQRVLLNMFYRFERIRASAFGSKKDVAAVDEQKRMALEQLARDVAEGRTNVGAGEFLTRDLVKISDAIDAVLPDMNKKMQGILKEVFSPAVIRRSLKEIETQLKANPPPEVRGRLIIERDKIVEELKSIDDFIRAVQAKSPTASYLAAIGDTELEMQQLSVKMADAVNEGLDATELTKQWDHLNEILQNNKKVLSQLGADDTLDKMLEVIKSNETMSSIVSKAYGGITIDAFIEDVKAGNITVAAFLERLRALQTTLSGADLPFGEITAEDLLTGGKAGERERDKLLGDMGSLAKAIARVKEENEQLASGEPWQAGTKEIIKFRAEIDRLGLTQDAQAKAALKSLEDLYAQQQRLKEFRKIADQMGDSFSQAFEDVAFGAKSMGEAVKDALMDISRAVFRTLITQPIANGISQFAMSAMGSMAGFFGNLFSPASGAIGSAAASGALGGVRGSAFGNIFQQGRLVPFALGGLPDIVNRPTYFPMAGGNAGVYGEAGPESIMPLKRGRDGKLGVQATGAPGSDKPAVIRNITVNVTTKDADSFRRSVPQVRRMLKDM